jgi:hypothetical protein
MVSPGHPGFQATGYQRVLSFHDGCVEFWFGRPSPELQTSPGIFRCNVSTGAHVETLTSMLNKFMSMAMTFGPQEWAVLSLITVVIGYMCLRGMNIR